MTFSIDIKTSEDGSMVSEIRIGEFREVIRSGLDFFAEEQYVEQWKVELGSIVDGAEVAAIISDYRNPACPEFSELWVFYRDNTQLNIQNILLVGELYRGSWCAIGEVSKLTPSRQVLSDDGEKISEWETTVFELAEFLKRCPELREQTDQSGYGSKGQLSGFGGQESDDGSD